MVVTNYRELLADNKPSPEISSLIELLRRGGIGHSLSRQKFELTEAEQETIHRAILLWTHLNPLIEITAMNKGSLRNLLQQLATSILGNTAIAVVSIFCPSYKLGSGAIGYNDSIGSTTKSNIARLCQIEALFFDYGIACAITIYFSDLLLENYPLLLGTAYREDLAQNYQDLVCSTSPWKVQLLSALGGLVTSVGEQGATSPQPTINPDAFAIVLDRNKAFYQDKLGWSETQTTQRTRDLALNYPYLADEINAAHPTGLYYWSESAWERSLLMPNLALPIVFPHKD
jgi:hypothetical protein